jgi:hypothetical protein
MRDYAKPADCNQVVHDQVFLRTVHMIHVKSGTGFEERENRSGFAARNWFDEQHGWAMSRFG